MSSEHKTLSLASTAIHRPVQLPALLCVALLLSACSSAAALPGDEAVETRAMELGYTVQRGVVKTFAIEDCAQLPSCYGNNATSPYAMWWLPPAPGHASPSTGPMALPPDADGRSAAWELGRGEAVVYVGRTAPEAAYYSYAPYLFARTNAEGEHVPVFASLSDAVNSTHVDGDAFGREIAIVITADSQLEATLRQSLRSSGLANTEIFTFGLADGDLRLSGDELGDRILMLQRFALFADESEAADYLAEHPAHVMRITPAAPPTEVASFDTPVRAPRANGDSELGLTASLDALESALRAEHAGENIADVGIVASSTITLLLRAESCIASLSNCLGEVSDTVYSSGPISPPGAPPANLTLGDAPGERMVALGVNHAAFGRATYSNMVVMNAGRLAGVAAMTDEEMRGSALPYIPDEPDADVLFAVSIMRDCGDESFCVEVPTGFPGVELDEALSFAFRAYVQPGAHVSANPRELLVERVLHITPSGPVE